MQRDQDRHLLKQPQLFRRVGQDKFAPVDKLDPGEDIYYWDEKSQQIVLKKPE